MTYTIRFRPEAKDDYRKTVIYYNSFSKETSKRFVEQVDNVLNRIANMPFSSPVLKNDVRKAVVKGFPYVVLYIVGDTNITIIAISNTYQNPKKWYKK